MKKNILSYFVVVVVFCCFGSALADTRIDPRMFVSASYDDNIFLAPDGLAENDFITVFEPGVELVVRSKNANIDLDYALRFQNYKLHSEETEMDFLDVQRALIDVVVLPDRDFSLILQEEISRVVVDERELSADINDLINKVTLYHTTINPRYELDLSSRLSLAMGYSYERFDYVSSDADDSKIHRYDLALVRRVSPSTVVEFGILGADYTTETNNDYELSQASIGVEHKLKFESVVNVEGGYYRLDSETGKDCFDPIWSISLEGRGTKKTSIVIATDRQFTPTVDAGVIRRTQATIALNYQSKMTLNAFIFARHDLFLDDVRVDRSFGGELQGETPLWGQFALTVSGIATRFEFLPEGEMALRYGAGCSLVYGASRGEISAGYSTRINDSTIDGNDYVNNVISLDGSLRF